ncbi:MAG: acyl-CoA dehydrogenase family protein [Pseudomonadota bacterium]
MFGLSPGNQSTCIHFSEEQKMIMESARNFCQDTSSISQVRRLIGSSSGYDLSVWQRIVELGWTGIAIPESFGGSGLMIDAVVPIVEAMGLNLLATPYINSTLAAQLILRCGTLEQRERWLPELAGGKVATVALLDDEDWGMESTAHKLTKELTLDGEKCFVGDASVAELFLVLTQYHNKSYFVVVERGQLAENAIREHKLIDQTKRAAKVDFSGVQIREEAILKGGDLEQQLAQAKLIGALLVAAESVGAATSCLKLIVDYLNTRKQFGKLIGSYQALKHPCVDILIKIEGARSQVYHATTLSLSESESADIGFDVACRMAKACANDALVFAADRAVQFHGGMGFTYECDAQLYLRRAQWSQQQFGDSAHHRKRLAPLLVG